MSESINQPVMEDPQKLKERTEQLDAKQRPIMIFGSDVTKIPCFKSSFTTGILSGIGIGIGTFMFTSRALLATHTMVGSFGAVTLAYYGVCRYQHAKEKTTMTKMRVLMQQARELEGVEYTEKVQELKKLHDRK